MLTGASFSAVEDCTEAIRLRPKYAEAYYNRGRGYLGRREFDRAIADFSEAARLDPNMTERCNMKLAEVYLGRGLSNFERGKYDEAIADYTMALQYDPEEPETYKVRARAYQRMDDEKKADADLAQAMSLGWAKPSAPRPPQPKRANQPGCGRASR